jgi:hypothetical protein
MTMNDQPIQKFCSRQIYEPTPEQLARLPKLYETGRVPLKDKPIYIYFFIGDCDWFVSESPPPATGNHLTAASALSSGRVLKAIAAPGAAL